jgi:hypothetical protein
VDQHAAGLGLCNRRDRAGVALREPLQVGPVVQRRAELRPGSPLRPELGVLHPVERDVDGLDAVGTGGHRGPLVIVAQVDDHADAVGDPRPSRPA